VGEVAEKHPVCIIVSKGFTNIHESTLVFYRVVVQVLWCWSDNRYACEVPSKTNRDCCEASYSQANLIETDLQSLFHSQV
jgi:hypothetical protein